MKLHLTIIALFALALTGLSQNAHISSLTGTLNGGTGSGNGSSVTNVPANTWWVNANSVPFQNASPFIPLGDAAHTTNSLDAAVCMVTNTGGTIFIGPGIVSTIAPYRLVNTGSTLNAGTNFAGTNLIVFQGSGYGPPLTNYFAFPTNNFSTVIAGPMNINRPNVIFRDINFDSGRNVCTNNYAGAVQGTLSVFTLGQADYTTNIINENIIVENCAFLCAGTNAPTHGLLFENTLNSRLSNIHTYYGTHGVVIKGWNVQCSDISCYGHTSNGFIVKVNDYASPGLRARGVQGVGNITVNGLLISDLAQGDTFGIRFDATQATASFIQNVSISGYTYSGFQDCAAINGGSGIYCVGISVNGAGYKQLAGQATASVSGDALYYSVVMNGAAIIHQP